MKQIAAFVLAAFFLASLAVVNPPQAAASGVDDCDKKHAACRHEALVSDAGIIKTFLMLWRCDMMYAACLLAV